MAIGRLLSDPFVFRVPSFQRPFSWTTKEAGQLLDDLMMELAKLRAGDSDHGHFLGAMLITEPEPWSSKAGNGAPLRYCDIVDGQQRLLTLTILAAVLRDLIATKSAESSQSLVNLIESRSNGVGGARFRIELRGYERDFFRALVQEPGATDAMPDAENVDPAEGRIVAVREHFLSELSEQETGELAQLASFMAERCHVALISVHSIDRAHQLFTVLNDRGRPLERKDILKAHILGQVEERARLSALAVWERTEALLGVDFENLFSHIRTAEGQGRLPIIAGITQAMSAAGGARSFIDNVLEPYGQAFHAIRHARHSGAPESADIRRWLGYMGWFESTDWIPPALLWWRLNSSDPAKLAAFIKALERLTYCMRVLGVGADKRQTRFQAVIDYIRTGAALDAKNSPLELSRDEQRNILFNLRSPYARSPLTCKLLLMRLNDELAGAAQDLSPGDYTVEHVLPQKPPRNSLWRSWFPSADEREACTNSLGNHVLVTRQQNDRARNMELARKVEVYFAPSGFPVPHLTAEIKGISEWRAAQVMAREERLLSHIKRIWRLDAPRGGPDAGTEQPPLRRRKRR